ncbi:hypothetical protein DFH28DRAFT_404789 [Melampsora americana]|nr:hypothetical protein DFH28DRAFT_404789 [Melampsora americana]
MKGSSKKMIMACAQILIQSWSFGTPTSAMLYKSGGISERVFFMNSAWCKPVDKIEPSSRDKLKLYLGRKPEDRSEPFFELPSGPCSWYSQCGAEYLGLMNVMLQSGTKDWNEYLQRILARNPSQHIQMFWSLIYELSDYMPTPVLQTALLEISQYHKALQDPQWKSNATYTMNILQSILDRYSEKIKQHVNLIEGKKESQEVINIFSKHEQEKLGDHQIWLTRQWTSDQADMLYKHWGSHMNVYVQVDGLLKEILETQVIEVNLLKVGNIKSTGHSIPYKLAQSPEPWMSHKSLTKGVVDGIQSLDHDSLIVFGQHQLWYSYYTRSL